MELVSFITNLRPIFFIRLWVPYSQELSISLVCGMTSKQHCGPVKSLLASKTLWEGNRVSQTWHLWFSVQEKNKCCKFSNISSVCRSPFKRRWANLTGIPTSSHFSWIIELQGIISDLFPGVVLPKPDYEVFLEALNNNIRKMKLQPVPWFIGKIIQVSFLCPSWGVPTVCWSQELERPRADVSWPNSNHQSLSSKGAKRPTWQSIVPSAFASTR